MIKNNEKLEDRESIKDQVFLAKKIRAFRVKQQV